MQINICRSYVGVSKKVPDRHQIHAPVFQKVCGPRMSERVNNDPPVSFLYAGFPKPVPKPFLHFRHRDPGSGIRHMSTRALIIPAPGKQRIFGAEIPSPLPSAAVSCLSCP